MNERGEMGGVTTVQTEIVQHSPRACFVTIPHPHEVNLWMHRGHGELIAYVHVVKTHSDKTKRPRHDELFSLVVGWWGGGVVGGWGGGVVGWWFLVGALSRDSYIEPCESQHDNSVNNLSHRVSCFQPGE